MPIRPVGYDEELKRVVDFALATKEALPSVEVMAPSTCSWWFCVSPLQASNLESHLPSIIQIGHPLLAGRTLPPMATSTSSHGSSSR